MDREMMPPDGRPADAPPPQPTRRPFERPKVTEFGSLTELTLQVISPGVQREGEVVELPGDQFFI
jgi:hypothetical protein